MRWRRVLAALGAAALGGCVATTPADSRVVHAAFRDPAILFHLSHRLFVTDEAQTRTISSRAPGRVLLVEDVDGRQRLYVTFDGGCIESSCAFVFIEHRDRFVLSQVPHGVKVVRAHRRTPRHEVIVTDAQGRQPAGIKELEAVVLEVERDRAGPHRPPRNRVCADDEGHAMDCP